MDSQGRAKDDPDDLKIAVSSRRKRGALEKVLAAIPDKEKIDYLEAVKRIPYVAEEEAPISRFLARENDDMQAAATRMVNYWRVRRMVFEERAFLPMKLSGMGALAQEDLETLRSGKMILLPNDEQGRSVVCIDFSIFDSRVKIHHKAMQRAWFYLMHVASENKLSPTRGLRCLILTTEKILGLTMSNPSDDLDIINAIPARIDKVYAMFLRDKPKKPVDLDSQNTSSLPFLGCLPTESISQSEGDKESLLSQLLSLGFNTRGVPDSVGGKWSAIVDLPKWIEERDRSEREILRGLVHRYEEDVYGILTDEEEDDDPASGDWSCWSKADVEAKVSDGVDSFTETEQVRNNAVLELENAMDLLPPEERAAYLEAKKLAPHLIEKESPPMRYIRFAHYNMWEAASRLASFWRVRKELFEDRAFLPFNLSGEGALSRADIAAFSPGK